ncbi:MAG: DUF4842 domain-containing protein, partial [Muribaculaceae bacterium]|nr:DUF4842 domain-containing protein [Muribaculaceae bacterium]
PQSADGNPYIAFRMSDVMESFFKMDKMTINYANIYDYFFKRPAKGYIFPVYWKRDKYGNNDYKVQFSSSNLGQNTDVESMEIVFSDKESTVTPFPELKYSPWCSSFEDLNIDNLFSNPYFYDGTYGEAYLQDMGGHNVIASRGIRIEDYFSQFENKNRFNKWYLEINYGFDGDGNCAASSESPYRNIEFWKGNYYDVPLKDLNIAHHGAFMFNILNKNLYIYDETIDECKESGKFVNHTGSAGLIGFNSAPPQPGFAGDLRDYCDVVFLYIPKGSSSQATVSTNKEYSWTIAAEDLGATDDWDFNDAVFTFSDQIKDLNTENTNADFRRSREWGPRDAEPVRVITVTPKAAGGIMPIYITYTGKAGKLPVIPDGTGDTADMMYSEANQAIKDYMSSLKYSEGTHIVGKELHSWLGADSYKTMVNTGEKNQNLKVEPVQFVIPADSQLDLEPKVWDSNTATWSQGSHIASAINKTISGFAVLVDRGNTLNVDAMNEHEQGMRLMENLELGSGTYLIGRPDYSGGEIAPQMILVSGGNWSWPQERVKISDAYPDFPGWLADPTLSWTKNYIKEKVTY